MAKSKKAVKLSTLDRWVRRLLRTKTREALLSCCEATFCWIEETRICLPSGYRGPVEVDLMIDPTSEQYGADWQRALADAVVRRHGCLLYNGVLPANSTWVVGRGAEWINQTKKVYLHLETQVRLLTQQYNQQVFPSARRSIRTEIKKHNNSFRWLLIQELITAMDLGVARARDRLNETGQAEKLKREWRLVRKWVRSNAPLLRWPRKRSFTWPHRPHG